MKKVQKPRKPLIVYYLIALGVLIVINFVLFPMMMNGNIEEVDYGTFLTMVEEKQVSKVQLEGETIYFTDKSETPQQYETTRFEDPDLVNRLYHYRADTFPPANEEDGRRGGWRPVHAIRKEQCENVCTVRDRHHI